METMETHSLLAWPWNLPLKTPSTPRINRIIYSQLPIHKRQAPLRNDPAGACRLGVTSYRAHTSPSLVKTKEICSRYCGLGKSHKSKKRSAPSTRYETSGIGGLCPLSWRFGPVKRFSLSVSNRQIELQTRNSPHSEQHVVCKVTGFA